MVSIHSPFIFPFFHILFKAKTREDGIRYISNANIFMDFKSLHAPKILAKIVYYYLQHRLHVHEIWNNLWTLQTGMPHKIYLSIITYRILYKIRMIPINKYPCDSYFGITYNRNIFKLEYIKILSKSPQGIIFCR